MWLRRKKIGLTLPDALRLLLVRVAAEKAPAVRAAQAGCRNRGSNEGARRGELVKVGKPEKLLRSLNARS
jgi:hypothetical protein